MTARIKSKILLITLLLIGSYLFLKQVEVTQASKSSQEPDLIISKIKTTDIFGLGKATQIVNEDMSITVTVLNRGKIKAGNSAVNYSVLKGKSTINTLPAAHQVDSAVSELKPHSFSILKQVWTPTKPGVYTIHVWADSQENITESNERNNCRTKKVTIHPKVKTKIQSGQSLPDIVVDNIYTYNDLQNDRFSVGVGLANWKGVACPGTFRVSLKGIDKNGNTHDAISFHTEQSFQDTRFLDPSDGSCSSMFHSIDFFFRDASADEIVILEPNLDANNDIQEINEENNKPKLSGNFINKNYWYKK